MSTLDWILVIGLVVFVWLGIVVIKELRRIEAMLLELLGSIAQALWRIRDELAQATKNDTKSE